MPDPADSRQPPPAGSPSRGDAPAAQPSLTWIALTALAVIIAGFCGIDRWVYIHVSLVTNTPNPVDQDLYHRTQWLWDAVRIFSSIFGGAGAVVLVALLHPRGWRAAAAVAVAVLAADTTGMLLQGAIGRVRPNRTDVSDPYSHLHFTNPTLALSRDAPVCFPSGEATAALALATALSILWPRAAAGFLTVAALCAAERILHGAHYLSDVVAGGLLGALITRFILTRRPLRDALGSLVLQSQPDHAAP